MSEMVLNTLETFKTAALYWEQELSNAPAEVELPGDFPRTGEYKEAVFKTGFGAELTGRLTVLSKNNPMALYTVLLTAFKVLLLRLTSQSDIVTASPVHAETSRKYNKYVFFRDNIDTALTFKELLITVKQTVGNGYKNEHYPMENLLKRLDLDSRSLTRFFLLLESLHGIESALDIAGNSDLALWVNQHPGELQARVLYNSLLFEEDTVRRLFGSYLLVLNQAVDNIDIPLAAVSLMTPGEKREILDRFNDTRRPYETGITIHRLFERQVEKTPDNTALHSAVELKNIYDQLKPERVEVEVSYEELNERADQLAGVLLSRGVGAGAIAAVMVQHPVELCVSLLAVLKAGGAYLPIAPGHPGSVKKHILEDSCAWVVLVEESLRDFLPETSPAVSVVVVDDDEIWDFDTAEPGPATASDLAYVIYTSGTTGVPKGVLVEHGGLVNYTLWRLETYEYTEEDVTLQPLAYNFDGFGSNFYSALLSGGQLVLVPGFARSDIGYIRETILDYGVTNMSLVPGLYRTLLEACEPGELGSLRFVVLAGEKSSPALIRQSKEKASHVVLINEYGPTEATVTAAGHTGIDAANTAIIGRPIANTGIHILDPSLNPVPVKFPGELCITGPGVARGYLNNPELTKQKFLRGPGAVFSKRAPGRRRQEFYRTGDLARWLPDGRIELLGRIDRQVKIRGHRIELGEIESRLLLHNGIKEAVVTVHEDKTGDNHLCAYIVPSGGEAADFAHDGTVLREYLSQALPDYSLPSYFIPIDGIPLTANGKIDNRALPVPGAEQGEAYSPPRNKLEEKLADLWSEVLGLERETVGIDTHFFEAGGHSIKVTILASRIHKELDIKLPQVELFNRPTIRELSEYISGKGKHGVGETFTAIPPAPPAAYYRLSSAQKRLYFLHTMQPGSTGYNIPQFLELEGDIDPDRLEATFRNLIRRHEALRTSFKIVDGQPVQEVHEDPAFEIETVDTVIDDFIRPFDLAATPLLRVGLMELETGNRLLMVDIHHIVSDGVSHEILVEDFIALYKGEEPAPVGLHYKDFAEWQNTPQQQDALKQQETFWLETFAEPVPELRLPLDFPRPTVQDFKGGRTTFSVDETAARQLNNLAKEQGTTLFNVLLAIYNVLLFKLSGAEDIVTGTPNAGRRHADLERVIGMFVNTLALRNRPRGDKTFCHFLHEVKTNTLDAFDNQEYPFENLVEKLTLKRDTGRNPLFDIMFVMQNMDSAEGNIPGLTLKQHEYKNDTTKFDLSLRVYEADTQLYFNLTYGTALFKPGTIERFTGYFRRIAEAVTEDRDRPIGNIDILTAEERQWVMEEFNRTDRPYPNSTVRELFEARVEEAPDRVAVSGFPGGKETSLTFAELNDKSNRLADVLRKEGLTRGAVVGLLPDRSPGMVTAIPGILKAGGAYLPMDPQYPADRIRYMLRDSGAKLVVTTKSLVSADLSACCDGVRILPVEDVTGGGGRVSNPPVVNRPGDPVHIIYTSGSTGKPRGVVIDQDSLVNFTYFLHRDFYGKYGDNLNIGLVASIAFAGSVKQIFPSLLFGHRLVIAPEETRMDGEGLIDFFNTNGIDISDAVPAHLKLMTAAFAAHRDNTFRPRHLNVSADVLTKRVVRSFIEAVGDSAPDMTNMYGPTEGCVDTTGYSIDLRNLDNYHTVPIGKPLPNTKIFILDSTGDVVPVGVEGDIYIAGHGLARGYLNNPELTAKRFNRSYRTYKTGDRGRHLPDGTIEYTGRADHQVNIRGYRVEPGEIEGRLLEYDGIKEAVVYAKTDKTGEKALLAFIVPASVDKKIDLTRLREYLSLWLPAYMLPSHFVEVPGIPLNASGKIDRAALEKIGKRLDSRVKYEAPADPVEEKLATLWREILNVDRVGRNDDFFELGGHSMGLITLAARVKKEFDVELSVMQLFRSPRLADAAAVIRRVSEGGETLSSEEESVFLLNDENPRKLFLFPPIIGYGLGYKPLTRFIDDFALYAFNYIEADNRIERYVETIIRIQPTGPYILFGYSAGGNLAFETAKALEARGQKVAHIVMMDSLRRDPDYLYKVEDRNAPFLYAVGESMKTMGLGFLEETVVKKASGFTRYFERMVNHGAVDAHIHLITAVDKQEREAALQPLNGEKKGPAAVGRFTGWQGSTRRGCTVYTGSGTHTGMFEPASLEKNAAVIRQILTDIGELS